VTTAQDIVTRSLRKIAVATVHEPVQAEDLAVGLDALNMMLNGWKAKALLITHDVDYVLADDLVIDKMYDEGIMYLLADRLSEDYQVPPPDRVEVRDWKRRIYAAFQSDESLTQAEAITKLTAIYDALFGTGQITFSDLATFGYDAGRDDAVIKAEAGKGVALYVNGEDGTDFALSLETDKTLRVLGLFVPQKLPFASLPTTASSGARAIMNNAQLADVAFNAPVTQGGGTQFAPVFFDGTIWRFG